MASMPAVKSFFLSGPAGRLEAVLNTGAPDATHAALVGHPHPLYGGTMHNKVTPSSAARSSLPASRSARQQA